MKHSQLIGAILLSAYFLHYALTPMDWHFIDTVNLIFHEAGHTIFMFFGTFIHVLMGSGFQVLLPAGLAAYFYRTDQQLASAACVMWVGQNLINVSIYAGDAIAMQLPLLGGDGVMHDWNYLLTTMNLLSQTHVIASTMQLVGFITILIGVGYAFYVTLQEPIAPIV